MQIVQSADAKARLTSILRDVERGESFSITRHGKVIARLIPEADFQRDELAQLRAKFAAFRERVGKVSIDDILRARHEGHRF